WPVAQRGLDTPYGDTANSVFVDSNGYLNLKVLHEDNVWKPSEVSLKKSLGYGTYEFEIKTAAVELDPYLVSSALIYHNDTQALNVALSKWHDPSAVNATSF